MLSEPPWGKLTLGWLGLECGVVEEIKSTGSGGRWERLVGPGPWSFYPCRGEGVSDDLNEFGIR